jgi:hypothetical protein
MSITVSTELLLRVAKATPEQQAAIERFLAGVPGELGPTQRSPEPGGNGGLFEALVRIEGKVDALREGVAAARSVTELPVSKGEAARLLLLLRKLEGEIKQWKAPPARVFRLTVLEGNSQAKTARLCGCVPALISRRVKMIESRFGMPIEQLRNFASTILEMEASVKGDRTRKQKHGSATDEPAEYEDAPERPDLVEDDGGYLPEERND